MENHTAAHEPAILVRRIEDLHGYCFGFRQRCSLAAIEMDPSADYAGLEARLVAMPQLAALFRASALDASDQETPAEVRSLLLLGRLAGNFQQMAGFHVQQEPRIVRLEAANSAQGTARTKCLLALPAHSLKAAARSLEMFVDLANGLIADPSASEPSEKQRESYEALAAQLRQTAEGHGMLRRFIPGALDLGVPFQFITSEVLQLGWGSKSRLQYITTTERTSFVGVHIAKSKIPSTALFRSCGIPTPANVHVTSEDEAAKAAAQLGYPVVVKPGDLDGGRGASADLRNEEVVRRAYRKGADLSSNVMVETHVDGSEYRMLVVGDRLFWAVERVPAYVIGDGTSSIRQLIDNKPLQSVVDPYATESPPKIPIDEDLEDVLRRRDMTVDSVPPAGEKVRLRDAALRATGGELYPVFDKGHPDNADLAVRAARLLRLDVAGVDFMSSDVGVSWRENGGCITEVNAGPQFGSSTRPDIYSAYVRELVGGDGRIPVAVVIGSQTGAIENELRERTRARAARVGIASSELITIGASIVHEGSANPSFTARVLTTDPCVDAIIWFTNGQAVASNGLPFDRIDLLVLAGTQVQGVNPMQFLPVIKDNVGEVVLEGGPGHASNLAQANGIAVGHANTAAQIVRKLLSILPKSPG